jgi:hypothetical protein
MVKSLFLSLLILSAPAMAQVDAGTVVSISPGPDIPFAEDMDGGLFLPPERAIAVSKRIAGCEARVADLETQAAIPTWLIVTSSILSVLAGGAIGWALTHYGVVK